MLIAIRAGHGGNDPGAVGPTGLHEADINLAVAKLLPPLFAARGFHSLLLRDRDTFVSLQNGVKRAVAAKADIFLSIHCNGAETATAHGFEVLHNVKGAALAQCIFDMMKARLGSHKPRTCYIPKRALYEIKNNPLPAVLVELEFITNPTQEAILRKPDAQKYYAETLAVAFEKYYKVNGGGTHD